MWTFLLLLGILPQKVNLNLGTERKDVNSLCFHVSLNIFSYIFRTLTLQESFIIASCSIPHHIPKFQFSRDQNFWVIIWNSLNFFWVLHKTFLKCQCVVLSLWMKMGKLWGLKPDFDKDCYCPKSLNSLDSSSWLVGWE